MKTSDVDIDDMCDEEKSYHEWVSKNLHFINLNKDHIKVMQKVYMDGFAAGFMYKNHQLYSNQMQK